MPSYGAQGLSLRLDRNATFASVARTPNERRVAAALETLEAGTPLYESVLGLASAEQASGAFRQLAGEIYPATQAALMRESRLLREAVITQQQRVGMGTDRESGFSRWGMEPGRQRRRGRWLPQPRHRLLGGRRRQPDADAARGLVSGYGRNQVRVPGMSASSDVDSYHLGAYASWRPGAWGCCWARRIAGTMARSSAASPMRARRTS